MATKQRKNIFAVLDIGSYKIACLIAQKKADGSFKILGKGYQYSEGIRQGAIVDLEAAEIAILATIDEAEQEAGIVITSLLVSLSAGNPKSYLYAYPVRLTNARINKGDIKRWITPEVFHQSLPEQEELIQAIPVGYILDGQTVVEPTNLYGDNLTIEVLLTSAAKTAIKNINLLIQRSEIKLERLVPSFMASALACLTEDEKEVGAIVVDMGSGLLSWSLWQDGYFCQGGTIKGGGFEVTEDVARAFTTSFEVAEEIKIRYGSCILSALEGSTYFDAEQIGEHHGVNFAEFSKGELSHIIVNRVTYQLQKLHSEINKIPEARSIKRIVLTGGVSELPGIIDLAGDVLHRKGHVRLGKPFFDMDNPASEQSTIWSTAIGLLYYGMQEDYPLIDQFLVKLPKQGLFARFIRWVRLVF